MTSNRGPRPFGSPQLPRYASELLGVLFVWRGGTDLRSPDIEQAKQELLGRMGGCVGPAKRRQKREQTEYWDAMTFLQARGLPFSLAGNETAELFMNLIDSLGRGKLDEDLATWLSESDVLNHTRAHLRLVRGTRHWMNLVVPRSGPMPRPGSKLDDTVRAGLHRMIEIDQTALGIAPGKATIDLMMLYALMAQVHSDLEIYCETGFQRIRKCEHRACGAFFCAKRMDGRGRFCSTACRVGHMRSLARKGTQRSSPPAPRTRAKR